MPGLRLLLVLVFASVLSSGVARAQPTPSAEARRLYAEGKAEYAQGHFLEAVELFERSYALSESPALLFNMAQAHRLAGPEHCPDALQLYKSYLLAEPEAENQREVEERIVELGDCRAAPKQPGPTAAAAAPEPRAKPVPAPTPAPAPRRASGLPTGPVLTSGAGAALLVAGGVLYARARDKHREAQRVCPCYPGTYSDWEVLTNVSYALLAVGGGTLAGGITWWVVGEPSVGGQPAQASLGFAGTF